MHDDLSLKMRLYNTIEALLLKPSGGKTLVRIYFDYLIHLRVEDFPANLQNQAKTLDNLIKSHFKISSIKGHKDAYAKYKTKKENQKRINIEDEDIKDMKWHKATNSLYLVTEHGVVDYLYQYAIDSKTLKPIPSPSSAIEQLVVSEYNNIYILGRSATKNFNIFRKEPNQSNWSHLTDNRVLGIPESQMVEPEIVHYPSFDGMEI